MFDFFNFLPQIPAYDSTLADYILNLVDIFFSYSLPILSIIVRMSTLKIVVPLIFFVYYFEFIGKFIIFLLKKIPFVNIK